MSEQQKHDVDLDAAIDAVAREMTDLDAPAGMRADVLARIEGRAARGGFAVPRWAMAAAAVVVIALGVGITQWTSRPTGPDDVRGTRLEPAVGGTPLVRGTRLQPGVGGAPSVRGTRLQPGVNTTSVRGARLPEPAEADGRNREPAVDTAPDFGPPPLNSPAPITIDALAPGAIEIAAVQVPALEQIQPVSVKDIPIGSTDPQRR